LESLAKALPTPGSGSEQTKMNPAQSEP
jgi:hypothetical protein